jgi:hypothetical protein
MQTLTNALTICNACEAEEMHTGCHMGYCADCCPAGGDH